MSDIESQIAAFFKAGGKVQEIPAGVYAGQFRDLKEQARRAKMMGLKPAPAKKPRHSDKASPGKA